MASRGARPVSPRLHADHLRWPASGDPTGAGFGKRGEPQDRQRDATSPRSLKRRKPSRWCETTRTERGRTGGAVGPRLFGATGIGSREGPGPGVDAARTCRWRGEQVTNPRRGRVPVSRMRASAPHRFSPRGTRQLCGRFEGEGNGHGVPTKGGSPPGSDISVKSSRAPGW